MKTTENAKMTSKLLISNFQEVLEDPNNQVEKPVLGLMKWFVDHEADLSEDIQSLADWFECDCEKSWDKFHENCACRTEPKDWLTTEKSWEDFAEYYDND